MTDLFQALRGAQHSAATAGQMLQPLLVVGCGGTLGSAVVAQALASGRFSRVLALVAEPVSSALRSLVPLEAQRLAEGQALGVETAVIVLERQRRSNGRDDAFVQPEVVDLVPLAGRLRQCGVCRLIVVVPHAPALMPQALFHGFASLEEAAVAELGFDHLMLLRTPQDQLPKATRGMARVAALWLAQLRWLVPQRQQALRAEVLARCVVQLARLLPLAPTGTRVIAPDQLWLWSQNDAGLESAIAQGLGLSQAP